MLPFAALDAILWQLPSTFPFLRKDPLMHLCEKKLCGTKLYLSEEETRLGQLDGDTFYQSKIWPFS